MRLLNVETRLLQKFEHDRIPQYAILSHTWEGDEASFEDMQSPAQRTRHGYRKILDCCSQARQDGLSYVWIDTCCIDKRNPTELFKSINSMFRWYQNAAICYAHLADVTIQADATCLNKLIRGSRWFMRGWTLQELIAPREIIFFTRDWVPIFRRNERAEMIYNVTCVSPDILKGQRDLSSASVAEKMSWASCRRTTEEEDMAYCLVGIFNISMPLLYGQGLELAFRRLQEEIMRRSDDQSIFAWKVCKDGNECSSFLAPSPAFFRGCGNIVRIPTLPGDSSFTLTNAGVKMKMPIKSHDGVTYGLLRCRFASNVDEVIGIPMNRADLSSHTYYRCKGTHLSLREPVWGWAKSVQLAVDGEEMNPTMEFRKIEDAVILRKVPSAWRIRDVSPPSCWIRSINAIVPHSQHTVYVTLEIDSRRSAEFKNCEAVVLAIFRSGGCRDKMGTFSKPSFRCIRSLLCFWFNCFRFKIQRRQICYGLSCSRDRLDEQQEHGLLGYSVARNLYLQMGGGYLMAHMDSRVIYGHRVFAIDLAHIFGPNAEHRLKWQRLYWNLLRNEAKVFVLLTSLLLYGALFVTYLGGIMQLQWANIYAAAYILTASVCASWIKPNILESLLKGLVV